MDQANAEAMRQINRVCGRYQDAWKRGDRKPSIEDYLEDLECSPRYLLVALSEIEYDLLGAAAPSIPSDEYSRRFPEHGA